MHYYDFNIKSFKADTSHLSDDEELAYRRLLDLYYDKEAPIPNETQSVSRRIKMGSKSDVVGSILVEFFTLGGDNMWHRSECDERIATYQAKCVTNKTNGLRGGRPKKNPDGFQNKPSRNPNVTLTSNQEPITNNSPDGLFIDPPAKPKEQTDAKPRKTKPALVTIPDDWKPHDKHLEKCRGLSLDPAALADQFRNHHVARATRFASWDAAFFTWIGNATRFGGTSQNGSAGHGRSTGGIVEAGRRVAARHQG
jgi:uncharacterized protein YdaU (DUF1376 family)